MPIVSNDKCKSMFLRAGRHEVIPEIFMCAGYDHGGRDSCQVRKYLVGCGRVRYGEVGCGNYSTTSGGDMKSFLRFSREQGMTRVRK